MSGHANLILALTLLAADLSVSRNAAAESLSVIPLSGKPIEAHLVSISDGTATFVDSGQQQRQLALSKIVRWGSLNSPRAVDQLLLSDGSILIGRVAGISPANVVMETDFWGELTFPRSATRGVIWHLPTDGIEQWKLRDSLAGKIVRDTLMLNNGDILNGRLVRFERDEVQFETAAGEIGLKSGLLTAWQSSGVESIHDADTARSSITAIGLRDGTQLNVAEVRLTQRLDVRLACGVRLVTSPEVRPVEEQMIQLLQPFHEQLAYLSDMNSLGHKHIPFWGGHWDWRADRNVLGGPLSSNDQLHAKGIGMHSTSRLAFDLPQQYDEFQSEICIDRTAGNRGSVFFRVFTTRDGVKWTEDYKSGVVRGGDPPVAVRVDVRSARRIALVVDFADRGDVLDRANWIGARLVKLRE